MKKISEYEVSMSDKDIIKYLISILGDISLDEKMFSLFIQKFHSFGGKYDVRTKKDTIKGIYEFISEFPFLSSRDIEEMWFIYIDDLFKEYHMKEVFKKYISIFGESEETVKMFISYVESKSIILDKKYKEESLLLDSLKDEYSESFISHLKYLIIRKHYHYEDIIKYLPSSELVKKDEEMLASLSQRTRIYFGCCRPISYSLLEELLEYGSLDSVSEELYYYVSTGEKVLASFSKSEYLSGKKLIRK